MNKISDKFYNGKWYKVADFTIHLLEIQGNVPVELSTSFHHLFSSCTQAFRSRLNYIEETFICFTKVSYSKNKPKTILPSRRYLQKAVYPKPSQIKNMDDQTRRCR